jgi:hypothetical protein
MNSNNSSMPPALSINLSEIYSVHPSVRNDYSKTVHCDFAANRPALSKEQLVGFSKLHPLHLIKAKHNGGYFIFGGLRVYEIAVSLEFNDAPLTAFVYSETIKTTVVMSVFHADTLISPLVYSLGTKPRSQLIKLRELFGKELCTKLCSIYSRLDRGSF